MDGWPRIPGQTGSPPPPRGGGSSPPPPGTVILAGVEEDLGEGVYVLRWAGNRLTVSSRARLEVGQSLILKSELSAEGKPNLVVQGPALPGSGTLAGRAAYGPPPGGHPAGQPADGGGIAAGVAAAETVPVPSGEASSLIGLILEPLPDFPESAEKLLREAAESLSLKNPPVPETAGAPPVKLPAAMPPPGAETAPPPASTPAPSDLPANNPPPEAFLKEALAQISRIAELPLPGLAAGRGAAGKMPDAVAEKAAAILLRAAGLVPAPAALEAAKALIRHNVQVDRANIQTLLSVAAGAPEAGHPAQLNAAARLLAHDAPLARPLVGGLADVVSRRIGTRELVDKAILALTIEPEQPEARPLARAARNILETLNIDLERSDAPLALERYVSTFGREALGKALALVEKSAQAILERHFPLPRIDKALTAILAPLGKSPEPAPAPGTADPAKPETPPPLQRPPDAPPAAAGSAPAKTPVASAPATAIPRPSPKAADASGAMPPEPGKPPAPAAPGEQTASGPATRPAWSAGAGPETGRRLDALYALPGGNRPEVETLRPSGPLGAFLAGAGGAGGEVLEKARKEAEILVRELVSEDPEKAEAARKNIARHGPEVLREAARRLDGMERRLLRAEPQVNRLAEAAGALRDLGRQLLATKAENLAGRDRDPGV
ncbi:MAG: hypothetical protein LBU23_05510, partial [Planctomycetota bacterium]|nr:hypothetical protein [Planctomycetota bacterium]